MNPLYRERALPVGRYVLRTHLLPVGEAPANVSSFLEKLTITAARHLLYVVCRELDTYSVVIKTCLVEQPLSP